MIKLASVLKTFSPQVYRAIALLLAAQLVTLRAYATRHTPLNFDHDCREKFLYVKYRDFESNKD